MWLGVSGASSSTSSLHFVSGRLLMRFSISHIIVFNTSSLRLALGVSKATRICRMVRIIRSHNPPWWEACGGLKDHSTSFQRAVLTILLRSNCRKLRDNSVLAPTIFVPLSDHTFEGMPRREMNLMNPLMSVSVSKLGNISIWTARVEKQE